MFKKLIEAWKKRNKEEREKLNPKPECKHKSGRFVEQAVEDPEWNELEMRYDFHLRTIKFWYCEECIGRK